MNLEFCCHLGTPWWMTDKNKTVVWRGEYYPFCGLCSEVASQTSKLRFPGQYHESTSGSYYNWHRYYGPKLGRYLQADPIRLEGGINLYSYTGSYNFSFSEYTKLGLQRFMNQTFEAR